MYKLLIRPEGSTKFLEADLGDTKPAITFQSNDIADMQNRKASFSQSIILPPSEKNCLIFGFAHSPQVISETPYRKHDCRLFFKSFEIFGEGSFLILMSTLNSFEVQLLSGVADLFDSLKTPGNLEGLCGYVGRGRNPFLTNAGFNESGVAFPIFSATVDDEKFIGLDPHYEVPFASVEYLLGKITRNYDLRHNIPIEKLDIMALPAVQDDLKSVEPLNALIQREFVESDQWNSDFRSADIVLGAFGNLSASGQAKLDGTVCYESNIDYYCSVNSATLWLEFKLQLEWTYSSSPAAVDPTTRITIENITSGLTLYSSFQSEDSMYFEYGNYISASLGDVIRITCKTCVGSYRASGSYLAAINDIETSDKKVEMFGPWDVAANLGFATQFDLFKALLQSFGAIVNVLESKKIVEMYTFSKIVENKPFARNWTEKLSQIMSTSFAVKGYAQKNHLAMKDNPVDNFSQRGTFEIDDTTLEEEKQLFAMPYEAGKDVFTKRLKLQNSDPNIILTGWIDMESGVSIASVPLMEEIEGTDGAPNTYNFKKRPPHLVALYPQTLIVNHNPIHVKKANHVSPQSLVNSYYSDLNSEILNDAKVIRARFRLDESDIKKYNDIDSAADCTGTFIPIYLKQFGKYFYINNIQNYVSGEETEVGLIMI